MTSRPDVGMEQTRSLLFIREKHPWVVCRFAAPGRLARDETPLPLQAPKIPTLDTQRLFVGLKYGPHDRQLVAVTIYAAPPCHRDPGRQAGKLLLFPRRLQSLCSQ